VSRHPEQMKRMLHGRSHQLAAMSTYPRGTHTVLIFSMAVMLMVAAARPGLGTVPAAEGSCLECDACSALVVEAMDALIRRDSGFGERAHRQWLAHAALPSVGNSQPHNAPRRWQDAFTALSAPLRALLRWLPYLNDFTEHDDRCPSWSSSLLEDRHLARALQAWLLHPVRGCAQSRRLLTAAAASAATSYYWPNDGGDGGPHERLQFAGRKVTGAAATHTDPQVALVVRDVIGSPLFDTEKSATAVAAISAFRFIRACGLMPPSPAEEEEDARWGVAVRQATVNGTAAALCGSVCSSACYAAIFKRLRTDGSAQSQRQAAECVFDTIFQQAHTACRMDTDGEPIDRDVGL
jgi:hypothetical protein